MQHRVFSHTLRGARRAFSLTSATGRFRRRLAASAGVLGTLGGLGCSLLYDLEAEQCSTNADCSHFGLGYTCNAAQVCQAPNDPVGNAGSGGNPSGGSGGQDTAGSSGMGGSAGAGPECTTNGECMDSHGDQPFVCREGTCVDLLSNECPFALLPQNLRSEDPIIIGAYTFIPEESVQNSVVTANFELALSEFTTNAPGGGLQNGRRKFIIVACDSQNPATLATSFDHLVDVVKAPAVLASLLAPEIVTLFTNKGEASNTFLLSAVDADSSLTRLSDSGLIWHILGSFAELAPAYVPLLERTETYVRSQPQQNLQPSDAVRVALVDDDTTAQQDISAELTGTETPLFVNGKSVVDPTNTDASNSTCGSGTDPCPAFRSFRIPSNGVPADYTDVMTELDEFAPHIIVSVTGEAFVTNVLEPLELIWPSSKATKPFYLLGPYHVGVEAVVDGIMAGNDTECDNDTTPCPLRERVLGINFESARDPSVLNSYQARFAGSYPQLANQLNFENFYDAAWYMLYAIAAAGDVPLTGDAIARGMGRLIKASPAPEYAVGPSAVNDVLFSLANLSSANGIRLIGAMGPPDFDPASGARNQLGSAYCFTQFRTFMYDVLRYESGGTPTMSGPPPSTCVPAGF